MPNPNGVHRHVATKQQAFRCYYCQAPIWERDPWRFVAEYRLTLRQAEFLRSTAEHLLPLSEGGATSRANIVAACLFCNSTRHKARNPLPADTYRARVQRHVACGWWFTSRLFDRTTGGGQPRRS
jgi:hypothetical protein